MRVQLHDLPIHLNVAEMLACRLCPITYFLSLSLLPLVVEIFVEDTARICLMLVEVYPTT